ncbi:hypothetical protein ABZ766_22125 [Streptomyces sp. NPDC006670]|uniref:hypothetical protein n=1 Tax=Streptomyces sp. NPDC006670 TaxID=3154476 RepID=UPI0033F06A0C
MTGIDGIDPGVPPNGTGCADCDAVGGWWFHLRRCAQCGHVGCCDSSAGQPAPGPVGRVPAEWTEHLHH